jgi:hypothetical protein
LKKSGTIISRYATFNFQARGYLQKKIRETTEKAPKVADKITGEYNGKSVHRSQRNIILMQTEIKRTFRSNNLQINVTENCSK